MKVTRAEAPRAQGPGPASRACPPAAALAQLVNVDVEISLVVRATRPHPHREAPRG
jgi:hypothetical protein